MNAPPVLAAIAAIEEADEAVLRRHLGTGHPENRLAEGLGELLKHFIVEQTPESS